MLKLMGTVLKQQLACHKARMKGDVTAATDCNDIAQIGQKAIDAIAKADAKFDGLAAGKCGAAGVSPAALGFVGCVGCKDWLDCSWT